MTDAPFPDAAGAPNRRLDAAAWDERWTSKDTPWDLGRVAPPLARALRDGLVKPPGRALVVGCGAGHDARAAASAGFDTTGIDLSPAAVAHARARAQHEKSRAVFEVADLFSLPASLSGADLVIEHTAFCAIDPQDRDRYVDAVGGALRPGGTLLALFWLIRTQTGPPFGATEEEIRHRFGRRFAFVHAERPADSDPARPHEFLCVLCVR